MASSDDGRQHQGHTGAREVRELTLGNLDVEHDHVSPAAGLIEDDELRALYVFAESSYEPAGDMPDQFRETEFAQRLLRLGATDMATRAIRDDNLAQQEYLVGMPDYDNDVSGLHTIQRLENWLLYKEPVKAIYLAGQRGFGKTDFAHLLTEIAEHRSANDPDLAEAEVVTNIPTSDYETITTYPEFKEWMESGDVDDNRWMIFDEASSVLTGYAHDREAVERLVSHLVKLARKYGVNLIIIGHTGMDLHADLRRLCDYVEKASKKTARFYATVNRGEGQGHLFDLDAIPATSVAFDTSDEAPWSWGDALDSEDDRLDPDDVKRLIAKRAADLYEHTELTQQEACDLVSGDDLRISRHMLKAARNGEYSEVKVA